MRVGRFALGAPTLPNVIAVIQDDRVRRQVEQYLGELDLEDLRFVTFRYNQEFQNLYFRDRSNDPPPPEGEEGAELKLFSEIHMVIFAVDSIGEKAPSWLDKLKHNLKAFNYWPESGTRSVMLKFEDDGLNKLDLLHPSLDDLIYLPLDRLVFLQKMQILLSLPKRVSPRYLFNQEVKQTIEISKITKIDRLSDVALGIRNPVPLRRGLVGHFFINFPDGKTRLELYGKVLRSEPHPEFPNQYLIYFAYFGISKMALTVLRQFLAKSPRYQSLLNDDRMRFRAGDDERFDDSTRLSYGVALIDSDEQAGQSLTNSITKEIDRVRVINESSFQHFVYKHFERDASLDGTPPKPTDESDFYATPLSLTLNATDLKCLSVDPGPNPEGLFIGHVAADLFADPEKWKSLLDGKEPLLVLEESVQLAKRGRVLNKMLTLKDQAEERRAVNFKIYKGATEDVVTVELHPASLTEIMTRMSSSEKEENLDAVIIEANFTPDDPAAWIEGVRNRAQVAGLTKEPDQIKFFMITDGEIRPSWLASKDVPNVFVRPVDGRQLMFLLSEYLPNHFTMYRFDNLGWTSPSMSVHVAKEVELEALSEFGATLKTNLRLAPGTMVYLRKSIFSNAPNQCLAARVYSCEEHPSDKGFFQVFTSYFGINDAFLKFARTWIRENYAQQKSGKD